MTLKVFFRQVAFALLMTVNTPGIAQQTMPEMTVDGMQKVSGSNLAVVYTQPGTDLGEYERIYLDDAYIAFKKYWQREREDRESNQLSADDLDRIKVELNALFKGVFSRTLEENGYQLAMEPAADVLRIKPAITNLEIVKLAKQPGSHLYSFSEREGNITLYLELYDSISGDIVARVIDRKGDRQTGYIQWKNRVSNRAAANRILQVWANSLKQGLDQARTTAPGAGEIQVR